MVTTSVRLGETLNSKFQSYCTSCSPHLSKSQAGQYLLIKYLDSPSIYSELQVRELREPVVHSISLSLNDALHSRLIEFSKLHGSKISEVFRMAFYQELIENDPEL